MLLEELEAMKEQAYKNLMAKLFEHHKKFLLENPQVKDIVYFANDVDEINVHNREISPTIRGPYFNIDEDLIDENIKMTGDFIDWFDENIPYKEYNTSMDVMKKLVQPRKSASLPDDVKENIINFYNEMATDEMEHFLYYNIFCVDPSIAVPTRGFDKLVFSVNKVVAVEDEDLKDYM